MSSPPPRPLRWEERAAHRLLVALGPRLPRVESPEPPPPLAPSERFAIPRAGRDGTLAATWFPAPNPRGAVLLLHPWIEWGQAYFHRRARIEALRAAGYYALTFDLPGFGASGPADGFFDRDVDDALAALAARAPGLPLHVAALAYAAVLPRSYRYLDMRRHAPHLRTKAVAFVSGEKDRGIRPAETEELARLAGGACRIVADAPHLGVIKQAPEAVIGLALATFEKATSRSPLRSAPPSPPPPGTSPAS